MAATSDQLLILTLLLYLVALVSHAASQAMTDRAPVIVGAAGLWSTGAAVVAQAGCLVTRGLAAERVPWGNMYEFIVALTLAGVAAWLVAALRDPSWRPLGLYVCVAALLLLGFAALRLYAPAGPLVPALNSVWLKIHVSAAAIASGVFMVGFSTAVAYLIRVRAKSTPDGFAATLATWLPAAPVLERLTYRLHAFGFPVWTFAVVAGAIWAEASWGRYWGWDPKETWAFISWVVYAGYLHARATPSVRRPLTAWLVVVGWLTMMFNLFAVNLLISGLHSYAGT
ncbi:c-type cytochrome biogenesis protein CcsB [Asanoa iriomotensis]|uniref:C-type cytochrome biogenesis protein CcsB n=1 Tax=Asanoa iriomotensis TaxID=234613 RepID=A0ABQ4BVK7_9ACTN|nr:c-type cytochrome biogenesis protein CcsB [Asanoa iriomotensis]GIF54574.1 c-type cytochrome biogenesis protein CcsB [Asanoa iriomotensis]